MPADPTDPFLAALRERVLVFDGAMGTSLHEQELTAADYGGAALEGWVDGLVLHRPEAVARVHRGHLEAGCDVVETCSFQATRLRLTEWGAGDRTTELNHRAAELARRVCDEFSGDGRPRFVAGSVGPSGYLPSSSDPSLGALGFRDLVPIFAEQIAGLVSGGADLIIIETAQDILEVRAAIFGARQAFEQTGRRLPLHISVSLDVSGRMLLGTDIAATLAILESLDIDVIGLNCSTGPEYMGEPLRHLVEHTRLPVACIPNAGIPLNVNGRAQFPLGAEAMAVQLTRFVDDLGIAAVGGCCGTTPEHIRQLVSRVGGRPQSTGLTADVEPELASSMRATALRQVPAPMLIGERVNAQGSRRVKRLLLEDDYESIAAVGRAQVEGGAHCLDVCVAVTERSDEAEQMRLTVAALQMTVEAPLCIDSTDAAVIQAALESNPGRALVNSVNLENGRARCEAVLPLVRDHGAAVVALTIDEVGMARTAERKLEVARRITEIACEEFGLSREQLLFDALTFTLATGEAEWRDSAVETIEAIRRIKSELPGVGTVLGVSNVSFGLGVPARAVLNSVFLHHCVAAGLDAAIVNPAHIDAYSEIPQAARELAENVIFNRSDDALTHFIAHFDGSTTTDTRDTVDMFAGMSPAERIHAQILHRRRDGIEDQIDLALRDRDPVSVLNEVLLPAMKDVGDRFGAGELILPFVLQSAEVMKRAVSHLEQFLERREGYTKGTVVLATVYGDVHDIGKNLVNTILSNNGYTVHDLGKQVPLNTIIDKATEVNADAIGLSALLVSTSKQMSLCLSELDQRGLNFPVIIGGAAINRGFGRRILYVDGDRTYGAGVYYCKDAFEGLETIDGLVDPERRESLRQRIQDEAATFRTREAERATERAKAVPVTIGPVAARSKAATDAPIPRAPFWGPRLIEGITPAQVYPHIDRNSLYKMSWQFRGIHDEERWQQLLRDELEPRLARSMTEAENDGWLALRALYGYWPALADGDSVIVFAPDDHEREIGRFTFPRQSEQHRLCLADYVRPRAQAAAGERDVIALQLVSTGPGPSRLTAELQQRGDYDDMLRIHGFSTQMAEATAEWLHQRIREELAIGPEQGRRYSWGYPACPDLADHATFFDIVPCAQAGVELTEGFQLNPEQSTVAIVLHHPEARYFAVYGSHAAAVEGAGAPEASPVGA